MEDADVSVAGLGKGRDTVGVLDSNHAAERRGQVYCTNRVASQGAMPVVPGSNDPEERQVPDTAVRSEGGRQRQGVSTVGGREEAAVPNTWPDHCVLRHSS